MNRTKARALWATVKGPLAELRKATLVMVEQEYVFLIACLMAYNENYDLVGASAAEAMNQECLRDFTAYAECYKKVQELHGLDDITILIKNGLATVNGFEPLLCPIFVAERDAAIALAEVKLTLMKDLIQFWEQTHTILDNGYRSMPATPDLTSLMAQVNDADTLRAERKKMYGRVDKSVKKFVRESVRWRAGKHQLSEDWLRSLTAYFSFPKLEKIWANGVFRM